MDEIKLKIEKLKIERIRTRINEAVDKHRTKTLQESFDGMTYKMFLSFLKNFPGQYFIQTLQETFPILLPDAKEQLLQFVQENLEAVKNTTSSVQAAIKNLKWYRDPASC